MFIIIDILIIPPILIVAAPTKHMITLASPWGGIYFNGQQFHITTYSPKESNGYVDKALELSHIISMLVVV